VKHKPSTADGAAAEEGFGGRRTRISAGWEIPFFFLESPFFVEQMGMSKRSGGGAFSKMEWWWLGNGTDNFRISTPIF
jgi:hypothetical protein